ncbi:thioesterase domain-containing protein [Shewanella sp. 10N.286.48.B5]|uniref:thioesterase domain-containing protein n=1 Tax=Shewanella sp. 10N.286.48.B5 TaxID=1880834 RepID=UPI000C82D2BB|nr:thioesterase domain-containing protein [Shewanella sp. 10N.286.48.B5]PMH85487.1 thioesterase [Shewanella sp. 10N.286.48.B5]
MAAKEQLIELQNTWYQTIPLSEFMQVQPLSFQQQTLTVTAPLEPNINLHQTMFAGSIYTLATLTGWGMMWLQQKLQGFSGDIVLADAHIRYSAPITEAPTASVIWPDVPLASLANGGKVKVKLEVQLHCKGTLCASFTGLYFSIAKLT